MCFKDRLKKFRDDNNLTQQELAEKLFVSRTLISKWEHGAVHPTRQHAETLAKLMNVSINDLISEEEAKKIAEQRKVRVNYLVYRILYTLSFVMISVGISIVVLMIIFPVNAIKPDDSFFWWLTDEAVFALSTAVYGVYLMVLGILLFTHTFLFKKIGKKFLVVISMNILAIIIGLLISPIALVVCVLFVGFLCLGCYTFSHIF